MAIIAQTIPDSKMASGMGIFSIGGILAQAAAPATGIALSDALGFEVMFLIALAPMIVALVFSFGIGSKPPVVQTGKTEAQKFSLHNYFEKSALFVTSINFLITCASATVMWYLVSLAAEKGISGVGLYFIVNSAALIIVRLVASKLLDKLNIKLVVLTGNVLLCGGVLLIFFAHSLWMILAAAALVGTASGIVAPSLQAESVKHTPIERRGVASSTYMVGASLAFSIGSFIAGNIAGAFGYANTFLIMCIPVVIATAIVIPSKLGASKNIAA
jgi:MFS family permease